MFGVLCVGLVCMYRPACKILNWQPCALQPIQTKQIKKQNIHRGEFYLEIGLIINQALFRRVCHIRVALGNEAVYWMDHLSVEMSE